MGARGLRLLLLVVGAMLLVNAAPAAAACKEISVVMPDGVHLDGWFVTARDGGRHPVLWTMTPYGNSACPGGVAGVDSHIVGDFNIIRLSYRGTGASEGVSDEWGPQTAEDVKNVADWIAAQPWADGLVPTGASAEGAWITYALQHPAVKAALWEMSCADALRGCIRTGGTLAGGAFALTAGIGEGYAGGVPQRIKNGTVTNPTPAEQWTGQLPFAAHGYLDDTNTAFWQERLGLKYLDRIHAPVMYTTDLYDFVPQGMYVAYEHTAAKYRWLNLGLGHNSPDAERTEGTPLNALVARPMRRFLEHFVLGEDNGFERDPRVTIVNNLGTPSGYWRGEVLVRPETRWPLPSTKWTRLRLGRGTDTAPLLSLGPAGELRTVMAGAGGMPAAQRNTFFKRYFDDLRPREAAGLTYTTPPLARDTELTGPVVAHLYASTTASDFDWQVRLTDVHPDGRSSWITDGQLRASLRAIDPERSRRNAAGDIIRPWYTFAAHQQVPRNKVVEYYVELAPTSNIFRAGDRIRIDVQPAGDAYVDSARTGGAGVLRLERDRSSVLLPLIPHRCGQSVAPVPGLHPPADCAGRLLF